jgi:hypothetical protein
MNNKFDNAVESNASDEVEANMDALETVAPATLGAFTEEVAFSAEDMIMPRVRLGQQITPEVANGEAKAGQYILTGYEPLESIVVIPGLMSRRRIYAPGGGDVLCRSGNAIDGVGTPGGKCATCPMSEWTGDQASNTRQKPECAFMYTYIIYVVDWQAVAMVDFKSSSVMAGKTLNTMVNRSGMKNFAVRLKAVGQTNPKGQKFYVMSIVPEKVEAEVLEDASKYFAMV